MSRVRTYIVAEWGTCLLDEIAGLASLCPVIHAPLPAGCTLSAKTRFQQQAKSDHRRLRLQ